MRSTFSTILLLVFICSSVPGVTAVNTSCQIQSVRPAEVGSLTCHFSENINVTRKDVTVKHYVNDTYDEIIVECFWVDEEYDCFIKKQKGYVYNKVLGSDLTVLIPNATKKHEGRYQCLVNGGAPNEAKDCGFDLLKEHTTCEIKPVHLTEATSLTCHFSENLNITMKDVTVKHYVHDNVGDVVVECFWVSGSLQCYNKSGYMFNKVITSHLTIVIPNSTEQHEGRYQCLVNGDNDLGSRACSFNLLPGYRQQQQEKKKIVVPVSVSVAVLILIAAVLAIILRERLKSLLCQHRIEDVAQDPEESIAMTDGVHVHS
ncbi:uncharacterized protein LOC112574972 [Pomacea canaliculata]|uniref:uncharacterized protein LOC112574972 n=1 Tax=Pomacea canaliculata TaxID=400727 RepID=UPI000D73BB97|nr:uncharacterized protein LOC112574972 [Pomacea canaliculata]